jgi:rubrerythrin
MKQMTEQHMINAFGGESMAHMRYMLFADQALKIWAEEVSNVE